MSAAKRWGWAFLLLGTVWLVAMIAMGLWHPEWADDISGDGGAMSMLVGAVMLRTGRGLPRVRDWRHAGKIRALEQEVAALKKHQADMKADLFNVMEQAIIEGGGELPADLQRTMPQLTPIRSAQQVRRSPRRERSRHRAGA